MGISLEAGSRPALSGRRLGLTFLAAVALSLAALTGSARPVAACSCVAFETMKDYANADSAIFTGIAGAREPRGVPVQVDQWLWGEDAAPVVWLIDASFGDSGMCGIEPPTPGTSWIWVAWRPETGGDFGTGLCSPHGRLDSPEGAAMLEEALALFGTVEPPGDPPTDPTDPPEAPTTPGDEPADEPGAGIPTLALVAGGVGLATVALFGGLVLVARRPRPGG